MATTSSIPLRKAHLWPLAVLAVLAVPGPLLSVLAAQEAPGALARVQLHRSYNRGVPYAPIARHGAGAGARFLAMRAVRSIELDGDPLANVYANLRPIDGDGDGAYEFVHFNGFRIVQVWGARGGKRWRVTDPGGRLNPYHQGVLKDTAAILDLDDDGRQDIAHCWRVAGKRHLVYRRGFDGRMIREIPLPGSPAPTCQIAAFRTEAPVRTLILVAQADQGPGHCPRNYADTWSRTVAFDLRGRRVWSTRTCDAGHFAYPLDADHDGRAEAIQVGKYLLRPDGGVRCKLSTWPANDHVDTLAIADLDPSRSGPETVAVGRTGAAMFSAATCRQIWRIPGSVIRNPQHVVVAKLDPARRAPLAVIHEKGSDRRPTLFVVDGRGQILSRRDSGVMPMQNANLDGARGVDEHVASFGQVLDRTSAVRLGRSWYWNLKGSKVRETRSGPYPTSYDRWQAFPLVFDYDGDGRDEIVQWGQRLIIVGKVR